MRQEEQVTAWSLLDILTEYKGVFEGDRHLEGKLKLKTDSQVQPVRRLNHRVPLALVESLKDKLTSLTESDIIKPVEISTKWINSLVVVRKPFHKLRICIDLNLLNKALERSHYPLSTIEDILPELRQGCQNHWAR